MADSNRYRKPLLGVLAGLFVAAGVLHFLKPSAYERVVPPYLPKRRALVYISGIAEIAGGLGLLFAKTRRWAGYGLIALLVAVFPANLYMATEAVQRRGWGAFYTIAMLVRLPLQLPLMAWVWWCALVTTNTD